MKKKKKRADINQLTTEYVEARKRQAELEAELARLKDDQRQRMDEQHRQDLDHLEKIEPGTVAHEEVKDIARREADYLSSIRKLEKLTKDRARAKEDAEGAWKALVAASDKMAGRP